MKKFYLIALLVLLPSLVIYSQESEETDNMIIEMQDGSKMTIAIDKVKEILFQKGNISVPGNDLLSLPEKLAQMTSQIESLNARALTLEALVAGLNAKLTTLETTTNALSDADFITNVTTTTDGGYAISFSKHGTIVIHNGRDGVDGTSPKIRINNGILEVSYDGGNSWVILGVISGVANGPIADIIVNYMEGYVTLVLESGSRINVPLINN